MSPVRKVPTAREKAAAEHAKARALQGVLERLTPPRQSVASVTLKVSAQGQFMPEVTITAGTSDAEVTLMVAQAVRALTEVGKAAPRQAL